MKKIVQLFTLIFTSTLIYAQEAPIELIERINKVEYIFEGVVLESKPYYSNE